WARGFPLPVEAVSRTLAQGCPSTSRTRPRAPFGTIGAFATSGVEELALAVETTLSRSDSARTGRSDGASAVGRSSALGRAESDAATGALVGASGRSAK